MSACLKGYEYKVRVISADEQEAIELNESINALKPVSYTHLDVYKRQSQLCFLS